MAIMRYTDTELITMIKHNDRTAFDYIYSNYAPLLLRIVNKMGIDKDNANQILEQVLYCVWTEIAQYDVTSRALYLWMHRLTQSKAEAFLESVTENIPMPALRLAF